MRKHNAGLVWALLVVGGLIVVGACGGSSETTNGVNTNSALCGTNGTNQCGARKCDPALGCVDCLGDADCPASARFCIEGECGACKTNADCGTGVTPACWPGDHTCHAACTSNASCLDTRPPALICDTATGDCVGCRTAADCPATAPICESATQQCVQCLANTDCPASAPRCYLGNHRCVQCLSNADCGAAEPICDAEELHCRAGCTADNQCPQTAPHCNLAASSCVQCLTNADCANTSTPICADNNKCVQCVSDTQCPIATPFCKGEHCLQCRSDRDCPLAAPQCSDGTCKT